MHKKLESELMSIAHDILQMKNKNDVAALKNQAQKLYEKLAVLAYLDEYLKITPDTEETQKKLVKKIELAIKGVTTGSEQPEINKLAEKEELETKEKAKKLKTISEISDTNEMLVDKMERAMQGVFDTPEQVEEMTKNMLESDVEFSSDDTELDDLNETLVNKMELAMKGMFADSKQESELVTDEIDIEPLKEIIENPKKQLSLEEEFKDAISVDVTADLFQKVKETIDIDETSDIKVDEKISTTKTTLNDTLMQKNIQVGLNDRIAFVKHLFNHSQADFNRVLSQLNSMKDVKDAKDFITKMVKPDYNWSGKEEYEERLLELIERKF